MQKSFKSSKSPTELMVQTFHPEIPSLRLAEDSKKATSSSRIKTLQAEKETELLNAIQQVNQQNQSLKIRQRQLILRVKHLHSKLKLFLSEEEINLDPIDALDSRDERIKDLERILAIRIENLCNRYQNQIHDLLECYGCSQEQSNISSLKSERDLVDFLITVFKNKSEELRVYEKQINTKFERLQKQIGKLKESLNFSMDTIEVLRLKELKYKQKISEVKKQWSMVCENLVRKDFEIDKQQSEIDLLKRKAENTVREKEQLKLHISQTMDNQFRTLSNKINQLTTKLNQSNIKYQQLYLAYEQSQNNLKDAKLKEKLAVEDYEKTNRELIRWKERYDWAEKQKLEKDSEEKKIEINNFGGGITESSIRSVSKKREGSSMGGSKQLQNSENKEILDRIKKRELQIERKNQRVEHR